MLMREKQEMALREKLKLRQQKQRRSRNLRRKSTILPLNNSMMQGLDEEGNEGGMEGIKEEK